MDANWLMANEWKMAAVGAGLFLFGWGYDWFVTYLHRTGREKGATAALVVGGVAVTISAAGIVVGGEVLWKLTLFFGCSGLPMVLGAWKRYTDERTAAEAQRAAEARRVEELAREMLDE